MNTPSKLLDVSAVLDEARRQIRANRWHLTVYRLGLRVGLMGYDYYSVPAPYENPKSVRTYNEAVRYGMQRRKKLLAEGRLP